MRTRNLLLSGLLFLFACGGEPATDSENLHEDHELISGEVYLSGLIDDKYEIYMKLNLPDSPEGEVEGSYYYKSQKKAIQLAGNREGDHLELDEFVGNENTGQFTGDLISTNGIGFSGVWKDNQKTELSVELVQSSADTYAEYIMTIDYGDGEAEALSWEALKNSFEKVGLPVKLDIRENVEMFDTNTVKKYFADDSWEDWSFGWNEWKPIFRFEKDQYIALVVEHFYTPGAFGVNNTFFEIYTFTADGKKIDDAEIGCYCHDTNMGANDYYATNDEVSFTKEGWIKIVRESIHATLFEEDVPQDELFDERDTTYQEVQILPDGTIQMFAD